MSIVTIVENYIFALLKRAEAETIADGTLVATVPELAGLIAYGGDIHECSRELYRLIEETVRTWLASGYVLPVIDGIDLNSEKGRLLSTYHTRRETSPLRGDFYEDEAQLEAAFKARDRTA